MLLYAAAKGSCYGAVCGGAPRPQSRSDLRSESTTFARCAGTAMYAFAGIVRTTSWGSIRRC